MKDSITFYSFYWITIPDYIIIFARTNDGKAIDIYCKIPGLKIEDPNDIFISTDFHPCQWYLINKYLPAEPMNLTSFFGRKIRDSDIYVQINDIEDIKILENFKVDPLLTIISVNDTKPKNVTNTIEYNNDKIVFNYGKKYREQVPYTYLEHLDIIGKEYKLDIEYYRTIPKTNAILRLLDPEENQSYYASTSRYFQDANSYNSNPA